MTYNLDLARLIILNCPKVCKIVYNLNPNKVSKMTHNCDFPKVRKNIKFLFCSYHKMLNLSPKELKVIAKMRGIKRYKRMSQDEL